MRKLSAGVALTIAIACAAPGWSRAGDVFAPGVAATQIYGDGRFTEAPDVAPDGTVYFADMVFPGLDKSRPAVTLRFDPAGGTTTVFDASNGNTGGLKVAPNGRVVSVQSNFAGSDDVTEYAPGTTTRRILADGYDGKPFNGPNDIVFDRAGRGYFTDVRYAGAQPNPQPVNGVYRLDPDGKVTRVVSDMLAPNGIALSLDGKRLYVAESPAGMLAGHVVAGKPVSWSIRVYTLAAGHAENPRTLIDFAPKEGADGMIVDAKGRLLIAYRGDKARHGILVIDDHGAEVDFVSIPETPSNLTFGRGADASTLYVTGGKSLYRVATRTRGWRP